MRLSADALAAIAPRYAGRIPRYTSYPTAVEFSNRWHAADWHRAVEADQALLVASRGKVPTSLYVHIPFCKALCFFCACAREGGGDRSRLAPYLAALEQEINQYARYQESSQIVQLHFGGGSPNFLTPDELQRVLVQLRRVFPHWEREVEFSVELDPRETSDEHIQLLAAEGCTRVSFGVQDFDPVVQRAINRQQSQEQTAHLISLARVHGIEQVNIDLIYGLPEQTPERWSATLQAVLALAPHRLAVYGYAHVDWRSKTQRAFTKQQHSLPTPRERLELFVMAHEAFSQAGYEYLGLDHFARGDDVLAQAHLAGSMRRNFMGYTTHAGARVFGFGASAISSTGSAFSQNAVAVEDYVRLVAAQHEAAARGKALSNDDQLRQRVIEKLMCTGAVDLPAMLAEYQVTPEECFPGLPAAIEPLVDDRLVSFANLQLRVTLAGRVFLRSVAALFDAYLPQYQGQANVFSAAV